MSSYWIDIINMTRNHDNIIDILSSHWRGINKDILTEGIQSNVDDEFDINDVVVLMCRYEPDATWEFIKSNLKAPDFEDFAPLLAASILEELLILHGKYIISIIERDALLDKKIGFLLGGVWPNAIDHSVWLRVDHIRSRAW